jgi:uncharacterized protein (TIGR01777 family)
MRIAITGASGFLGQPLRVLLTGAGHTVLSVGRRRSSGAPPDVVWDLDRGEIDDRALSGIDAVVHLAGENLSQRWTDDTKRAIRESRVRGTDLIARTIAALRPRPALLVSMSAIGIYGDRGDEALDEASTTGTGFFADTGRAWEAAAAPAAEAGIRVVHPRMGVVLHHSGGALARMLPFFSLGLGGRVGDGRQWMSWIARTDALRALEFLVMREGLAGPVNVTAPAPVTNAEFTRALAGALHRPALAVVPTFGMRLLYGEMGVATVVDGQRVLPRALLAAGFAFSFPGLEAALAAELER